jgi:hypothetical protein
MKPGRNDPCPCGSGKKYKQCCLGHDNASGVDPADRLWRQMREAIDGYAASMLRFIGESYGKDALQQAWLEFTIGASDEFVQGDPNTELFFSWLFHRWKPDAQKGNRIADPSLNGVVPTRAYLNRRASRLSPLLWGYLETCLATPFGFHEILDCQPGVGFTTKDVFSGAVRNVRERSASATLKDGEIIFAQIVPVQSIAMMEAVSPFSFPPIFKTHLIHVRQRNELREHPDLALRGLYFSLAAAYLNPPPQISTILTASAWSPVRFTSTLIRRRSRLMHRRRSLLAPPVTSFSRKGSSIATGHWSRRWFHGSNGRTGNARVSRRCSWEEFASRTAN